MILALPRPAIITRRRRLIAGAAALALAPAGARGTTFLTLDTALSTVVAGGTTFWTLSNGNLSCLSSNNDHFIVARPGAAAGQSTGKFMFEMTVTTIRNDTSEAIAVFDASGGANTLGAFGQNYRPSGFVQDATSPGGVSGFPNWSAVGSVVSVAMNLGAALWWACVNGASWWGSGTADPATNTGGRAMTVTGPLVPGIFTGGSAGLPNTSVTFNFGATSYTKTLPAGYSSLPGLPAGGGAKARLLF